jgi:N-acetylglucosaminyldiphosphoundecaprenol N-acetyl-beta-D-mannosaminyltransferase
MSGQALAPPAEIRLLGYRMHPMTADQVIDQIVAAAADKRRLVMANINLHGMAVMYDSPAMARLLCQDDAQVMIDGMPIIAMGRIAKHPLTREMRVTSLDFYDRMFAIFRDRGWKIGYVGGSPDVLERGLAELRRRVPGLDIDGRDGFFDMGDDSPGSRQAEILSWLDERSHDMLIVGMGMPRQEEWIARIQHRIPTRVLVPTGAYLDYQIGAQALPPRWMGQMGVEWAYRLVKSPRRLGHRYLIEPMLLVSRMLTRRHPQGPA